MNLKREGKAGTEDDSDIIVEVSPAEAVSITIESKVKKLYGKKIQYVIEETLKTLNVTGCNLTAKDNGALDYTIRARVRAAVRSAEGDDDDT